MESKLKARLYLIGVVLLIGAATTLLVMNALDRHRSQEALDKAPKTIGTSGPIADIPVDKSTKGVAQALMWAYVDAMNGQRYEDAFKLVDPDYAKAHGLTVDNLCEREAGWFPGSMLVTVDAVLKKNDAVWCKLTLTIDDMDDENQLIELSREVVLVQRGNDALIRLDNLPDEPDGEIETE